jgi:TRAP-type uncharacterized transport system fused permease subunit
MSIINAANLFTFYFAIISNKTPPVAVAAYAGAGLAKVDPLKNGYEAFFLASAGYLVPFVFVYNPALVLVGRKLEIVYGCITTVLGVVALSGGIQGWFWGALNRHQRIMIVVASILLIWYGFLAELIGILRIAVCIVWQKFLKKEG